ncbi:MAG: AraC family ligand binding domain-containing protein [Gemmatimonadaceae bacterium]
MPDRPANDGAAAPPRRDTPAAVVERRGAWRVDAFGGVDLGAATYTRHAFSRHMHEGFAVAVVEAGAGEFTARGARHVAPAGAITVLHPEEAHTGAAARPGRARGISPTARFISTATRHFD